MLKYSLVENLLTDRGDDYSAMTHCTGSLDKEAIITKMLDKGTLLTRTDILAVLNTLEDVVEGCLLDGYNLTFPLFNASFSISGVFESPLDSFDGNRHKLNINLTKGVRIRETERNVKFEKANIDLPHPVIQEVKDVDSNTVNEKLTPTGIIDVRGYNLKIEGDSEACGLYFVEKDGTAVKAAVIAENKPVRIMAKIPSLPSGEYQVKVVTQYTGAARLLKKPKTAVYPKIFIVEG